MDVEAALTAFPKTNGQRDGRGRPIWDGLLRIRAALEFLSGANKGEEREPIDH